MGQTVSSQAESLGEHPHAPVPKRPQGRSAIPSHRENEVKMTVTCPSDTVPTEVQLSMHRGRGVWCLALSLTLLYLASFINSSCLPTENECKDLKGILSRGALHSRAKVRSSLCS